MQTRRIGSEGFESSAVGYGAMGTATAYGPADDVESIAAIRRAHDLGVTHFDTAEMYGWGAGEELLGAAVRPFRDEITIATKFGLTPEGGVSSQPEHIREVVDASLRRLDVDCIDLLYQHAHDPSVPVEDVVGVMTEFVDAGKVRYLGLSNTTVDNVRTAHAVHPITALQAEYSLFSRETAEFFPVLEELGIGFVGYSPLARGFLSGAAKPLDQYGADDYRQGSGWWQPGNFEKNLDLVAELAVIAENKGITLSQLALAWLLAQKDYIVPIPGSKNPDRVAENIAAASIELTPNDLARIDAIVPHGAIGPRFIY